MSKDLAARKTLIVQMMRGFPSSSQSLTEGSVDAYVAAVDGLSLEALAHACKRFASGQVPNRNNAFLPSSAELAEQTRLFADVLDRLKPDSTPKLVAYPIGELPPPPLEPLGPISVDFGDGKRIDMRHMTLAEKEAVFAAKGLPKDIVHAGSIASEAIRKALKK